MRSDLKDVEIGDRVLVENFFSKGERVGTVEMEVEMVSIGTVNGSISRIQLSNEALDFIGWFRLDDERLHKVG